MDPLSRRERQIMDIVYRRGTATAAEVQAEMPDEVSYSTVRAQLRILEEKGFLKHEEQGTRYKYSPLVPRDKAGRSALRHLLNTFFDGSAERMVATLLTEQKALDADELDRLAGLIRAAKKEKAQ